jgi:glycosyltransferase involved in cell wall biosynthesis
MLKIALILRHIGPYHHARLEALSRLCEVSVFLYGDLSGVAYGEFQGRRSYRCSLVSDCNCNRFQAIKAFFDAEQPDVIALPGWSEREALFGLRWALQHKTPTVVFSDSQKIDEARNCWKEWLKSRIVRLLSTALVAGQRHVQYITELGFPVNQVFLGYDVVDNDYFQRGALKARASSADLRHSLGLPERFFLASNRFLPRKNVLGIVAAYAQYRHKGAPGNWGLVLLGDGPQRAAIESAIEEFSLHPHVLLCGMRSYDELPIFYGLASAFVHASYSEQWGLVVNEAMAVGLPVFVSKPCGCVPDLIAEGVNGYSFNPKSTEELASHMVKAGAGEYELEAMGTAGKEIISRWSPALFAENLLAAAQHARRILLPKGTLFDRFLLWILVNR